MLHIFECSPLGIPRPFGVRQFTGRDFCFFHPFPRLVSFSLAAAISHCCRKVRRMLLRRFVWMRPHPVFRVAPSPKETTPIEIFLEDCDKNDGKDSDEPRKGGCSCTGDTTEATSHQSWLESVQGSACGEVNRPRCLPCFEGRTLLNYLSHRMMAPSSPQARTIVPL